MLHFATPTTHTHTLTSPVNDLLDRGDFTLMEIFDEDDVLQEIKSMNTRLIDFLAQKDTLEEMVGFLVEAPGAGADDKRVHKYPYMACEVLCCEVDHVLDALVAMRDGQMIDRIFSLLDAEEDLDDRLSGYFEKVVFVLLRRKCLQLMAYLNSGGLPLFRKFVRHLNNYSIMQIVERLFLHQPGWDGAYNTGPVGLDLGGSGDDDASGSGGGVDLALLRCNWSNMPEVVDILVDQLVEGGESHATQPVADSVAPGAEGTAATHTHVAELLLTVIDNASPDSVFIKHLTDKIARLAEVAIPALDLTQPPEVVAQQALAVVKEERSSMLSALTIVEALLSRPQAIKLQWDMGQQQASAAAMAPPPPPPEEGEHGDEAAVPEQPHPPQPDEDLDGYEGVATLSDEVVEKLIASLPLIRVYLQTHERDDRTVNTQIREPAPKLGLTRLKLVRHVEALVKLCSARMDRPLEMEGVLKVCLDMFFKYEWTSVLHQSITRIVTWIMDAGPSRLDLQTYLVKECDILERILWANENNDRQEEVGGVSPAPQAQEGAAASTTVISDMEASSTATPPPPQAMEEDNATPTDEAAARGDGEAQVSPNAPSPTAAEGEGATPPAPAPPATAPAAPAAKPPRCRRGYMGHLFIMSQAIMEAARNQPSPEDDPIVAGVLGSVGSELDGQQRPSFTRVMDVEVEAGLRDRWTDFTAGRLAQVTATQGRPLGGYPIPSRADENKLTTKFDEEPSPDFDEMSDMLAQRLSGVDVRTEGGHGSEGEEGAASPEGSGPTWREETVTHHQPPNEEAVIAAGLAFRMSGVGDPFDEDDAVFTLESEGKERFGGSSGSEPSPNAGAAPAEGGGLVAGGWAAKALADGTPSSGTFGEGWADFSNVTFPPMDAPPAVPSTATTSALGSSTAGDVLEEDDDFFSSSTTVHLKRGGGGLAAANNTNNGSDAMTVVASAEDDLFSSSSATPATGGEATGGEATAGSVQEEGDERATL